jgi:hypothetical protein
MKTVKLKPLSDVRSLISCSKDVESSLCKTFLNVNKTYRKALCKLNLSFLFSFLYKD